MNCVTLGEGSGTVNANPGRHSIPKVLIVAAVLTLALSVLLATIAVADTPESYVPVASGKFAGRTWTLGAVGDGGRRCFALTLISRYSGTVTYCEADGRPPDLWQRRVGSADESSAVELDITSSRVWKLELLLGHPGRHSRPSTWETVATRIISPAQAAEAHLGRNFRFAVHTGRGANLCVEKVRAFDREGELLESRSVPCEY
jgi:hypothetical protein